MIRLPPRSTRTYTLVPYTTLFRSAAACLFDQQPRCQDLRQDLGPFGARRIPEVERHAVASVLGQGAGDDGIAARPVADQRDDARLVERRLHCCTLDRARLVRLARKAPRSEEHTSELQSLMRISYAVFCLKKT